MVFQRGYWNNRLFVLGDAALINGLCKHIDKPED